MCAGFEAAWLPDQRYAEMEPEGFPVDPPTRGLKLLRLTSTTVHTRASIALLLLVVMRVLNKELRKTCSGLRWAFPGLGTALELPGRAARGSAWALGPSLHASCSLYGRFGTGLPRSSFCPSFEAHPSQQLHHPFQIEGDGNEGGLNGVPQSPHIPTTSELAECISRFSSKSWCSLSL